VFEDGSLLMIVNLSLMRCAELIVLDIVQHPLNLIVQY
jgi:hypothetical protein